MPLQPFYLPGPSALALFNLPLSPFSHTSPPILNLSPLPTSPNSTHPTQLDTPVPPQPLCFQSYPHAFRHTWGCASVSTSHFELSTPHRPLRTCPRQRPHQCHSASIRRPLFSYSYALFCKKQNAISHLFIHLRTLCRKHPGWGYTINQTALLSPHAQTALRTFSTFIRLRLRELP